VSEADVQERIALLRAALPPVVDQPPQDFYFTTPVCLDCEWDRKTGALQTIGIGDETLVIQFDWGGREFDHVWFKRWLYEQLARTTVVIHNAAADIKKLRESGIVLWDLSFKRLEDSMLAHAVLESELPHDLEFLSAEHGTLPPYKDLSVVAPVEYNAADVVETALLWKRYLVPALAEDVDALRVYNTLSMPFLWLGIEGDEAGIAVHPTKPVELYRAYDQKRTDARHLAQAYCGWPVNLNSPDQVKHVLYNLEGLPVQMAKKQGWGEPEKVTADKDALAYLRRYVGTEWDADVPPTLELAWAAIEAGGNPFLEARYLHTGAQQAISHYIEPCLTWGGYPKSIQEERITDLHAVDRIYPECRIHVQASGRVGYVGPALPQMKGKLLDQLVPDPGTVWFGWDWKQIEVRLLALLADDEVYLDAFAKGLDIHEINVRAIWPEKGSPDLEEMRRRWIKAFVFRLHYLGEPENASDIPNTRNLGLDNARRLVEASDAYLAKHPALHPYWDMVGEEAERTGISRTFLGRPRRLHGQFPKARKREAVNHRMQGAVADVYIVTALAVKKAAPWARLVFGAYDSQWWQIKAGRELEFAAICGLIVEQEWAIGRHKSRLPADWKFKRRDA
jgi:DNA polymerase I-like protein with 3'-5' exonuclease and polymerase domains